MLLHDAFEATLRAAARPRRRWSAASERVTYASSTRSVDALARAAAARAACSRGDRVALFLDNGVEFAVGGASRCCACGAVFMPINPLTKADKLAYMLDDTRAARCSRSAALRAVWQDALARSATRAHAASSPARPATATIARVRPGRSRAPTAAGAAARPGCIDQDLAAHHLHLGHHRRCPRA